MKLVFVSSTFKDMQFERDAINTFVTPLIDSDLAKYGEGVYFGDLRWGVNTTELDSEESSKKVLDVCLDEIDNCKPYMIVLIGERYGWIPGAELLHNASVAKGIDTPDDISVTQLEIEYGALLNPDYEGRILFYFRSLDKTGMTDSEKRDYEAESDLHRAKLDALKARILEVYPDAVRSYEAKWNPDTHAVEGLDPLMNTIREDLTRIFLSDINRDIHIPWQRRAMNSAHRYFTEHSRHYVDVTPGPRASLEGAFVDNLDLPLVTLIEGEQGSGKTSFISNEYREYLEAEEEKVMVPFVMGLDDYSTLGSSFLKILLYAIEEHLGIEPTENDYEDDDVQTRKHTVERIKELLDEMPCAVVAVIDDCDYDLFYDLYAGFYKGSNDDPMAYLSTVCEALGLYLVIAYSSRENKPLVLAPNYNFASTFIMDELAEDEKREFIKTVVRSRHKELSDVVADHVIGKAASASPLYIKLVVDRLLLLDSEDFANIRALGDGMDNINKYMISIVDNLADDLDGITVELVKEAAERIDTDFVYHLLGILASFPDAIKEYEIRALFEHFEWEYSALNFALTVKTLSSFISYNPVRAAYQITNRQMLDSIRRHLDEQGYGNTPELLLDRIFEDGNEIPDWYRHSIRLASLMDDRTELIDLFHAYYENHEKGDEIALPFLTDEFLWLLENMDGCAEFVRDLVLSDKEKDYTFLLRKLPIRCQLASDFSVYTAFLADILELLPLADSDDTDASYNTFAMYVRVRLIEYFINVDLTSALGVYRDELAPNTEKYYHTDTILEIETAFARIVNAAVNAGIVERVRDDVDPLEAVSISDEGFSGSVIAGHYLFVLAEGTDPQTERYAELLIDALNRYNRFNPTEPEQRRKSSPDDFVYIIEAFARGVAFFMSQGDRESAEACLVKLNEFFRIGFYYFGSRILRCMSDLLYAAEQLYLDDEEDDFAPLKIRASVCRMIGYRSKNIEDGIQAICALVRYLRIYDSTYEIEDDEEFAEMLGYAVIELDKYLARSSDSDLRMSALLSIFLDVELIFKYLKATDDTESIGILIDSFMQITSDEELDSFRGIEIMRDYLYCCFDDRSDADDVRSFISEYENFRSDADLNVFRKVCSDMIETIDDALADE